MSPALPSSPPEKGGENGGDGEEKVMGGPWGLGLAHLSFQTRRPE